LENIRSYKDATTVTFTTGTSLFEGDIGSGKSSILSAIEFALFGLGNLNGTHLLRGGTKRGHVLLEFEVEGNPYQISRSLRRRRNRVHQDEGYIVENGVQTSYRPTELKARILQILKFNEPLNPRSQSVIYRYAIFTPQEMMKDVLTQHEDRRLETLRKAFRMETYRRAVDNASGLTSALKGDIRELQGVTRDLPDKQQTLQAQRDACQQAEEALQRQQGSLEKVEADLAERQRQNDALDTKRRDVEQLEAKIPQLEQRIGDMIRQCREIEATIERLCSDQRTAEEAQKTVDSLSPAYQRYIEGKTALEGLEEANQQHQKLTAQEERLTAAIQRERELLEKTLNRTAREIPDLETEVAELIDTVNELPQLTTTAATLKQETNQLDQVTSTLTDHQKQLAAMDTNITNNRTEIRRKKREWKRIKDVGIGAPCPRCQQTLTKDHYLKVQADYEAEILTLITTRTALRTQRETLTKEIANLETTATKLKSKTEELQGIQQKIAGLKEQAKFLRSRQEHLNAQRAALDHEKQRFEEEQFAEDERGRIAEIRETLTELQPSITRYTELKTTIQQLEKDKLEARYTEAKTNAERKAVIEQTLQGTEDQKTQLQASLTTLRQELETSQTTYEANKNIKAELQALRQQLTALETRRREIDGQIAATKQNITILTTSITELEDEITTKETEKNRTDLLNQIVIWLSSHFIPALESIERHVLTTINLEFNTLFQKWFNTLIEHGDIAVRIDENFTPFVEQEGYELDVLSLSGGERTSVALAYRLALNTMVKRTCEAMTSSLLILDEPTDGFSREQLDKLREILEELNCEQVIMVSHEKELEGFFDHLYRISKVGGVSEIKQIA
jgi:exonuclease SbcC